MNCLEFAQDLYVRTYRCVPNILDVEAQPLVFDIDKLTAEDVKKCLESSISKLITTLDVLYVNLEHSDQAAVDNLLQQLKQVQFKSSI